MYRHVLLPRGGSGVSDAALKQAILFAKARGAKLALMHVVQPFHLNVRTWATPEAMMDKIGQDHDAETLAKARKVLTDLGGKRKRRASTPPAWWSSASTRIAAASITRPHRAAT